MANLEQNVKKLKQIAFSLFEAYLNPWRYRAVASHKRAYKRHYIKCIFDLLGQTVPRALEILFHIKKFIENKRRSASTVSKDS